MSTFGLRDSDLATIRDILSRYATVQSAELFGSRAKGTYRNGSDVDLALKGPSITPEEVLAISSELNEGTLLPYQFDILHYERIETIELTEHIDRAGVLVYSRMAVGSKD